MAYEPTDTSVVSTPNHATVSARRFLTPVYPTTGPSLALTGPLTLGRRAGPGVHVLDDRAVSGAHCKLRPAPRLESWQIEDLGSKNGTWINGWQVAHGILDDEAVVRVGDHLFVYTVIPQMPAALTVPTGVAPRRAIAEAAVGQFGAAGLPILILGPTGAGKELLAERAHRESERTGRFVAVNCATLQPELVASALFGHVRGAFTGAQGEHRGFFAEADGGTLFLDEVADLAPAIQPMLLRALETGVYRPVGARADAHADVRLVAATQLDIEARTARGAFRADLLARLSSAVVRTAPLNQRRADVLPLLAHFLERDGRQLGGWLEADAAQHLLTAAWPNNVRGLRAFADRTRALHGDGPLTLDRITGAEHHGLGAPTPAETPALSLDTPAALQAALSEAQGNLAEVARRFGLTRQSLYRRIKRMGLDPKQYR